MLLFFIRKLFNMHPKLKIMIFFIVKGKKKLTINLIISNKL